MKKAFSLMEVLISTVLLSVAMLAMYKMRSNSIHLVEKSKESKKKSDYLLLSMNSKTYSKKNDTIYLDKQLNIIDDDIRREFKEVKVDIKDELLDSKDYKVEGIKITIEPYKTKYSLEDEFSREIYGIKIKL